MLLTCPIVCRDVFLFREVFACSFPHTFSLFSLSVAPRWYINANVLERYHLPINLFWLFLSCDVFVASAEFCYNFRLKRMQTQVHSFLFSGLSLFGYSFHFVVVPQFLFYTIISLFFSCQHDEVFTALLPPLLLFLKSAYTLYADTEWVLLLYFVILMFASCIVGFAQCNTVEYIIKRLVEIGWFDWLIRIQSSACNQHNSQLRTCKIQSSELRWLQPQLRTSDLLP